MMNASAFALGAPMRVQFLCQSAVSLSAPVWSLGRSCINALRELTVGTDHEDLRDARQAGSAWSSVCALVPLILWR